MDILSNYDKINTERYQRFMITEDTSENIDFCKRSQQKIELRSYQQFPGEYLKENRGLLIDHGLGAGKTKTAVQTITTLGRDTVIMVPASLHGNFDIELNKVDLSSFAATSSTTGNINIYYLHYNAGNLVDQYNKIGQRSLFEKKTENKFSGKLIIIEESHIFFQNVISGKATIAITIFQRLMEAEDIKILCLTGTPITGDPFEVVPLFNLLRGYMKEDAAGSAKEGTSNKGKGKNFPLFPTLREDFYRDFISTEFNAIKNKEVFQDRITGLVSYYKGILDPEHYILPKIEEVSVVQCPMGSRQWKAYISSREREWDYERFAKYKTTAFKEGAYKKAERASAGTYKTTSAQMCNFAFPDLVEQKYESHLSNYGKVDEISAFKWKLLLENFEDPYKFLFEHLADHSGKLAYLIPKITSQESQGKKIFIYSKFQIVGALVCSKMLIQAGYEQVHESESLENGLPTKQKRFIVVDGAVKDPYKLISFYNRAENLRGEYCQIIIGTSVIQAGISLFDMREGYCLESQWRANIMTQVKGRMIRTCSHERLSIEERVVKFFILTAVPPTPELRGKISLDDGKTTDEFLYELALRKAALCDTFIDAMHEVAVDCYLNRAHNGAGTSYIDCRTCINSIPVPIIPADYKIHLVNGSRCTLLTKKTTLVDFTDITTGEKFKKDDRDNLYKWSTEFGKYEEIGFIKNGEIILNDIYF